MSTRHSPLERTGLRRAVLQLASLQLLALLLLGLLSLFAVWSLDRDHGRNLQALGELGRAIDAGRSAQLDVKRQVQEWKNTLLRGGDPRQFDRYVQAGREARARVTGHLSLLRTQAPMLAMPELESRIDSILVLHETVSAAYERGVSRLSERGATIAQVDEGVRGVDRPLDEALDALVLALDGQLQPRIDALREASQRRFETLMRALWLMLGVVTVLVASGVWRIIGSSRNSDT